MGWSSILPGVFCFHDSCNVHAVIGPAGAVIVDAGTGAWIDHLDQLPAAPVAVLCTHYFPDHSAGAARAAAAGIPVWAPEHEADIFLDPAEHFRSRQSYIVYENLWDHFAPIEPTPLAGILQDYAQLSLAGLTLRVIPLPGATMGQAGLLIEHPASGRRLALVGETIHSPGRLPRVAPLQYNYNDLSGAGGVYYSLQALRRLEPDALLPSLGAPMLDRVDDAMAQLQGNLRELVAGRPGFLKRLDALESEPLTPVTEHLWAGESGTANTHFLISRAGKAMALDYGWNTLFKNAHAPGFARRERRRPLLHSLDALRRETGIKRIDVALVSHFHDDHVSAIPLLQRLHETQCWAAESFADLIADPAAHAFPCNWPQPIRVDRRLALDAPFSWEEYRFELAPMSGHTRFGALIGFEVDGQRVAHTGDQYFFHNGVEQFEDNLIWQNHVYRNGCLLDGFAQSGGWMLKFRPDIVLSGHQPPMRTNDRFFEKIEQWTRDFDRLHRAIMPLGDDETHFNVDSWGGWIWPYRTHLKSPASAELRVTVRNPLPRRTATLTVRLVGPEGWVGGEATLEAAARAEVSCDLTITPDSPCRRQPFAAELTIGDQRFGQVAEALIAVGGERF